MVKAMLVLLDREPGRIDDSGPSDFEVMPRVGDHLNRDAYGEGQVYRVAAVHRPNVFLTHAGSLSDHLADLVREARASRLDPSSRSRPCPRSSTWET